MTIEAGDLVIKDEHKGCIYLVINVSDFKNQYPDGVALVLLTGDHQYHLCATRGEYSPIEWRTKDGIEKIFKKIGHLDLKLTDEQEKLLWPPKKGRP